MKKIPSTTLVIIAFALFPLFMFSKLIYSLVSNQESFTSERVIEYDNLFTKEAKGNMQLRGTTVSKNSEPLSRYIYKNQFYIEVTKFSLANQNGLTTILTAQNTSANLGMYGVLYSGLSHGNLEMKISSEKNSPVSSIYFKCNGDLITKIREDNTICCYYSRFKQFSIGYNDELFITGESAEKTLPASVAFIKKDKILYLLLMTIREKNGNMEANQLYDILQDKETSMVSN